jgi:acyl carrier protein
VTDVHRTGRPDPDELVEAALAWVRANRVDGGLGPGEPTADTDLLSTGLLDSLSFIGLLAFLEERSGRTVDLGEMAPETFCTLAGLCGAFAAVAGGAAR